MPHLPQLESAYECPNGHITTVFIPCSHRRHALHRRVGSAWDFCDECAEGPNAADQHRMLAVMARSIKPVLEAPRLNTVSIDTFTLYE